MILPTAADRFLAAMPGDGPDHVQARMRVAGRFFEMHAVGQGASVWQAMRRALQCIDYGQPVLVGPPPPAPIELVRLPATSYLGDGHFILMPAMDDESPAWWEVSPIARYLRWFSPRVDKEVEPGAKLAIGGDARFFIPAALVPGQRLVRPL